ncbi:MAG: ATP-binding region, ATPase-like:Histidine kinase N-terminal:Osmosensitive channel His kinase [Proteobacteria bacterium]|nr:ATP-binding region, ATPase-like:Histidine kinase N-terminal:Osmosensitive channel His kinase [Pseudomonadota bacterium]
MSDQRPDPDQLLSRLQAEEARAARGKLKIFFGSSAGVGKTYAMLSAARTQLLQGADVVIGVIETHGRTETEVMTDGLERLPKREIEHRGNVLREFDLDGALARKPALILMDELAHSNIAGSRHPKRWQDVEELLAAGIDVYSTVNVQHLESLNDVVSGITGIRVWETVPDKVFDSADEVILVDLTPDELLQRLKEGKVYLPNQAERAINNFFRKGNLLALRELALRRTADRVDEDILQYRRERFVTPVWQTRESLLACIGPDEGGEQIVRATARIAGQLVVPWHAIYVETPGLQRLPELRRQRILKNLKLAQDMGAQTTTLTGNDAVAATIKYAREHNLSKIVVAMGRSRRWPWQHSFTHRIGQQAPDIDVIQIARNERSSAERSSTPENLQESGRQLNWSPYAKATAICAVAGLLATPLHNLFDLANIVMFFLLAVVLVAVRYGRGPAVLASFLCVGIFDFFFVQPRFSFAVSDVQYLLTFAVMLAVGLVVGQLTAGYKHQATIAQRREQRVHALYEMARDLSAALLPEQIEEIGQRFLAVEFDAHSLLLLTDAEGRLLQRTSEELPALDMSIAQWAFEHGEAAGFGTDTLPGSPVLYLPLKAPMRLRGILALELRKPDRLLIPEQQRLLDAFASLLAIAIERVHYVDVAQSTTVQMESERLRNSLLSAISHDLRTPLSALLGLSEGLFLTKPPLPEPQAELTRAIHNEAMRTNALVNNLLDMARLQAGKIRLDRQWQPVDEVIGSALRAAEAGLDGDYVNVAIADDLPLLEIDSVLTERVLCNLLENAGKYTPEGSLIDLIARRNGDYVELIVEDNGPGLPAGKEELIFHKFERGQPEGNTPGVGLGLAICRAIVEAHNGFIRAENRAEGGARFIVSLPIGNPPEMLPEDELPQENP